MTPPDPLAPYHQAYVLNQAPVLFFRLDRAGRILETNRHAEQTAAIPQTDRRFQKVVLDFSAAFDLAEPVLYQGEHLMSINTRSGYPESYLFSFTRTGSHILVFGHMDYGDLDLMRKEMLLLNQELGNTTRQLHKKNAQLQGALAQIKTLEGLIPICSYCHSIRTDREGWEQLEAYLEDQTGAEFSHGICPTCLEKYFPEHSDNPEE